MASENQGWLSKILGGKKAQNKPEPQVQNAGSSAAEATQVVGRAAPSQEFVSHQEARANVPLEWNVGDVILDTYEVKQIHGGGGMGLVYCVFHRDWELDLAVKSPRAEYFQNQQQKENFVRECLTWIGLGLHEHIVCCYYVRMLGNVPRVFAEYMEGGSLKDWIDSKRLYEGGTEEALKRILDIAIQAAWGLQHAHGQGLVHQDVKPANVLLTPEGIAKVTDFGLAKARAATAEQTSRSSQQSILVSSGGHTPAYCSPEQANKQPLMRRTDIWSFGLSILEMFSGEVFWQTGQLAPQALQSYLKNGPEDACIPKMPASLADLLSRCFEVKPDDRPKDMAEVIEALKEIYEQSIGSRYSRSDPTPVTALADVLSNQGVSLIDLGYLEQAEAKFNEALKIDPLHPEAIYNRGLLAWRLAKITDVALLERLEESGKHSGYEKRARILAAQIHVERGDAKSTVRVMDEVSLEERDSVDVRRLLGLAHSGENCWGRCLRTFEGHTGSVNCVAVSPDGCWGLSGGSDMLLLMWKLSTGKCVRTFRGHTWEVESVAISPDGQWGLSGSKDKTLRLWKLSTGKCLRTLEGHTGHVTSVAVSPDGRYGLSGSRDQTLRFWELSTGQYLRTFQRRTSRVGCVAVSPDGRWGLSGSKDKTLRLWELSTGRCVWEFEGHTEYITSTAVSQDGRCALSGSEDRTLRLWDLSTGSCLRTFEGHTGSVTSVAINPDGRWGLSGSMDKTLRLWDLSTGQCLRSFEGHTGSVTTVAINPDGRWGLSGSMDKTLRLWELSVGHVQDFAVDRPQSARQGHEYDKQARAEIVRAGAMLEAKQIESVLDSLKVVRKLPGYDRFPRVLELWRLTGRYCRLNGLRGSWCKRTFEGHTRSVTSVAVSPDGRFGLSGSEDGTLRLWDLSTGQCLRTFKGHIGSVTCVAITPDGQWGLSGNTDHTLRLWELSTSICKRVFAGHDGSVTSVATSRDGRWVLSGSKDKTLRLWELPMGKCLQTFEGHTEDVTSVAVSPDGQWGLSGSKDRTLRLWKLSTGKCLQTFEGHTGSVTSVAIRPDGRCVLSHSEDKTLRLWELSTGDCFRTFERPDGRGGNTAISPDGQWALSMGDGLRLWELSTGRSLWAFEVRDEGMRSIAISPDGQRILSGGHDNTLRLWELDWEYEFPGWAEWDAGAIPYLGIFLTLRCPCESDGFSATGKPAWTARHFNELLADLQCRGYGWLRAEGVHKKLREMASNWQGPPSMLREKQ